MTCSAYNLVAITIFNYLEIVYPSSYLTQWLKRWPSIAVIPPWMIGISYHVYLDIFHTVIIDNICYAVSLWSSELEFKGAMVSLVVSHIIPIIIFCTAFPQMIYRLNKPHSRSIQVSTLFRTLSSKYGSTNEYLQLLCCY